MKNVLYICIGALLAALAFSSCNDEIDIRQDYDFSLSSWYLHPFGPISVVCRD